MPVLTKPEKRGPKPKRRIPKRSKKDTLLRRLKKKAWALMSYQVRKNSVGLARDSFNCYACRGWFQWEQMHAAHFCHGKLDYDPMNVKACCVSCNTYKHGNLGAFALHLVEDYGEREVQALIARASQHKGYSIEQLEEIIKNLENQC